MGARSITRQSLGAGELTASDHRQGRDYRVVSLNAKGEPLLFPAWSIVTLAGRLVSETV